MTTAKIPEIECAGAPRDLGFDQGRACGAALRARLARSGLWTRLWLRAGCSDPHSARVARDLRRHFPHQAEWLAGVARGAGVPLSWLERELSAAALSPSSDAPAVAAASAVCKGGSLLAGALARGAMTRHSRPEGGFRSVELALPWRSAALAGVNEAGLALVSVSGGSEEGECSVPPALFVQDCLQRFDGIEAALEWCLGRPAGGGATLLLADASGEVVGVELARGERRVLRPTAGLLLAAGGACEEGAAGAAGGPSQAARLLREGSPLDAAALAAALSAGGGAPARLAGTVGIVCLDPAERRLGLLEHSHHGQVPELRWLAV